MITYELYCRIHDHCGRQGLTVAQAARALGIHRKTVGSYVEPAKPAIPGTPDLRWGITGLARTNFFRCANVRSARRCSIG